MNACKINWLSIGIFSLMLGLPSGLMAQDGSNANVVEGVGSQREIIELGPTGQGALDPFRAAMHDGPMLSGNWIWTSSGEPIFARGVTAIAYAKSMGILLAGGPDYIATSRDNGLTWTKSFNIEQSTNEKDDSAAESNDDDDDDDSISSVDTDGGKLSSDEKVRILRDFVERELETQFTPEYADLLLNEITDDELLAAEDMYDLDSLSLLELNFDTDLTHLFGNSESDSLSGPGLPSHGSYFERFTRLIDGGADYEQAEGLAAQRDGIWQFATTNNRVLAITNNTLYASSDGMKWTTLLSVSGEHYFLDVDISSNAQVIVIGMTDGLQISEDAGKSWRHITNALEGVVFDVALGKATDSRAVYALTTEGWLYASQDLGTTWFDLTPRAGVGEVVMQILPSVLPKRLIALTPSTIFLTEDLSTWSSIPHTPFENESLVQIASSDPRLESFVVRSSKQIYSYQNGWSSQNTALFTRQLGTVLDTPVGMLKALLATPSGLWVGVSSKEALDVSTRHETLSALWQKEPSDELVLQHALKAHYLDDDVPSWAMRARLSWLLPRVVFDYKHSQDRLNRNSETTDLLTGIYLKQQFFSKRETRNEWQIMGYWDINFASKDADEIRAVNMNTRQNELRLSIIDDVERALMTRRQLQMTGLDQATDTEKEISRILAIAEVEAELHYLTGGYYKTALNRY